MTTGELVGARYRLTGEIGRGATSRVYRAYDEHLGREVAIKQFLTEAGTLSEEGRRRSEARLLAGLDHPGVVRLLDAALTDEPPYLVMELVEGETLHDRLDRGPLAAREAAELGAAVAAGLSAIHDRGVVHRDVKPSNVLIPEEGASAAKLVDFGIARAEHSLTLTAAGELVGTAHYLSPEQARGQVLGSATDVYSLGLTLVEALTGERPFPGTTLESAAARLTEDPDLTAPPIAPLRDILHAMTARDPAERPAAIEVAARLRERLDDLDAPRPTAAPVPTVAMPAPGQHREGIAATETLTPPPATAAGQTPSGGDARGRLLFVVVASLILLGCVALAPLLAPDTRLPAVEKVLLKTPAPAVEPVDPAPDPGNDVDPADNPGSGNPGNGNQGNGNPGNGNQGNGNPGNGNQGNGNGNGR